MSPERRRLLLVAVALAAACLALYGRSLSFGFLSTWDDEGYVTGNPVVTDFGPSRLPAAFTGVVMGNWAPLHVLTYAAGHSLWGPAPAGYRAVNLALHGLAAFLAFLLVRRVAGDGLAGFLAALLFAVHPANVESVAWISQTKTVGASACALLSMLLWARHRETGRRALLAASVAVFAAGILFKASIVTLPLAVFAYERWIGAGSRPFLRALPYLAVGALGTAAGSWAQVRGGAVGGADLDPSFLLGTVYPTMLPVLWRYASIFALPVGLNGFYDATIRRSFLDPWVLAAALGFVAAAVLVARSGSRQVRFWAAWVVAFLLPATNIVPLPVYLADRYLYLPAVGLCALLVLAARRLCAGDPRALAGAAGVLAAAWFALAWVRLGVWRDDGTFWEDTARRSPGIYKAHLNLGIVREREGRLDEAEREYLAALALFPSEKARFNLEMLRMRRRASRP